MERTEEQKQKLLKDLWYKRNPSHDKDQNGVDRFWGTVLCVFNDYQKALTIPVVVKRYRVEAISINKKHLFDKEIDGLENASEVLQDLKIKYLDTYTSVKMTEI